MADKILKIKKSTLVDIADQVRAKTGSTDKIKVSDLDDAVANISAGSSHDPMELSTYNNPEFGFYYGQVVGFNDPITFDIPFIIEKMNELGINTFQFFGDIVSIHFPNFKDWGATYLMPYCIDFSYSESDNKWILHIYSSDSYRNVNKEYEISDLTQPFTFTFNDVVAELLENSSDDVIWPLNFGFISPNNFSAWSSEVPDDMENLNNPDNAIYKGITIGK